MDRLLNLLALIAGFLESAAPEIRERCADVTYQKLSGISQDLQGLMGDFAQDPGVLGLGFSSEPHEPTEMELLMQRLPVEFEKLLDSMEAREARDAQLVQLTGRQTEALEGLLALLTSKFTTV